MCMRDGVRTGVSYVLDAVHFYHWGLVDEQWILQFTQFEGFLARLLVELLLLFSFLKILDIQWRAPWDRVWTWGLNACECIY